ncbi:hypothetical protein J1N35_000588 [Gossypium stocksii]|uniref:Uncharacterized protein n=1 Tax=Gossypium stocksii TaxID=47602 RepID=A0A9D4AIS7_9ROSI|nr:hypothetical protein J1N35_000588 [Gossypium stocksii]
MDSLVKYSKQKEKGIALAPNENDEITQVFDCLSIQSPQKLIFERIGKENTATSITKPRSIHSRLGSLGSKMASHNKKTKARIPKEPWDFCCKIPSQMKRHFELKITTSEVLKAKRHTVIITNTSTKEEYEDMKNLTSNRLSVKKVDEESQEEEAQKAP